jgi:hypothetical protein
MTPETLVAFRQYVTAYSSVLQLLDAALDVWPATPTAWPDYERHLRQLDRHGAEVAAVLVREGGETPEGARRILSDLFERCAAAKSVCETGPCSLEHARQVRACVEQAADPLRQCVAMIRHGLEARPADGVDGSGPSAELPPEGTKFATMADVPAAFREGGKPDGPVLTVYYLRAHVDWGLSGPYLAKHYGRELTTHVKVGRKKAYLYTELLHLRRRKTANEDAVPG